MEKPEEKKSSDDRTHVELRGLLRDILKVEMGKKKKEDIVRAGLSINQSNYQIYLNTS